MRGKSSLAESHEFICKVGSLDEIVHAPHAGVGEIEDSECARNQTNANVGTRSVRKPAHVHERSILRSLLHSRSPNVVQVPWRRLTVDDVAATLRSVQQLDRVDGSIRPAGPHAVLRPRGAEAACLGVGVERPAGGRRTRVVGVSDAGGARGDGRRTWLHFRNDADRVDRRRLDLSLQHCLHDRTIPGDEGFHCGVVLGQAIATRADRLLLRRLSGGHGRRRRASGHCRIVSHRARLQPVSSRDAVSRGQHRARGVGRSRQSDSCARRE